MDRYDYFRDDVAKPKPVVYEAGEEAVGQRGGVGGRHLNWFEAEVQRPSERFQQLARQTEDLIPYLMQRTSAGEAAQTMETQDNSDLPQQLERMLPSVPSKLALVSCSDPSMPPAVQLRCLAVVHLEDQETGGFGTGFIISPTLMMTCNHVIPDEAAANRTKVAILFRKQTLCWRRGPQQN